MCLRKMYLTDCPMTNSRLLLAKAELTALPYRDSRDFVWMTGCVQIPTTVLCEMTLKWTLCA